MNVGVLAPKPSWHFRDLRRAAGCLDECVTIESIDFRRLSASTGEGGGDQFFNSVDPVKSMDSLIVRTMPSGSLQQVVFRMDWLHRLANSGVNVVNSPRSVEIAIDKYLSLSLMSAAGIRIPAVTVCQSVDDGMRFFESMGRDVVLKPVFGSMGKHVHRLSDPQSAAFRINEFVDRGELVYLQKFISHRGSDIRILVVGDETFAMRRCSPHGQWLTNVAQGGKAIAYSPSDKEVALARHAAKVNGCLIAGVDLVYASGDSDPFVLEVNAAPGWQAIQQVSCEDVAAEILRCALKR